jgi:hypothetical protein
MPSAISPTAIAAPTINLRECLMASSPPISGFIRGAQFATAVGRSPGLLCSYC